MKHWTGRVLKNSSTTITDETSALYLSEFSQRKNLQALGVVVNEGQIPEIFLQAFVIIEAEINKFQNDKMKKKPGK